MSSSRRNILVVFTDEQASTFLGSAGNPDVRTPNIDALAREGGALFDNAYTANGVCVPSRCCALTGRYPIAHGVAQNSMMLNPREDTMGRIFSRNGYVTGYFGKTHFGRNDDDMPGEGWQDSFIYRKQYNQYLRDHGIGEKYPEGPNIKSRTRYWNIGPSNIPREHYFENAITDRAVDFIHANCDRNFLCFVAPIAPHGPFTPPPPYDSLYDPAKVRLQPRLENELEDKPAGFVKWITQNRKYITERELRIYLAHVYGLITLVDDNVGRLVAALKDEGLYDDTLVLFTSDHGDFSTRFGVIGKSWCTLDAVMKVPLVVSAPGCRDEARRIPALVDNTDMLPTLLDFAGIPIPRKVQGVSMMPLLDGGKAETRDAVFAYNQSERSDAFQAESMIRRGKWKFIATHNAKFQLYDLESDPWEATNLIDDPACREVADDMKDRLLRWHLQRSGAYFPVETARFWEDETLFYDETKFCGERIKPRGDAAV